MARPGVRSIPALCCECLLRAPNHDVVVVTMARAELSSHRVGIHKVSRMARAGCLFEGVMVANVGCSSIGPGAEVIPSGVQGESAAIGTAPTQVAATFTAFMAQPRRGILIAGSPTQVALE